MDAPDTTLRILLIEDSVADATLILRALRDLPSEFDSLRIASEEGLRSALIDFVPHVILSDFSMPGFSGQRALEIVMADSPQVPFLFVSGTIGEELAIDALQRGAQDYVLKENLLRLPSAVARALRMAEDKRHTLRMQRDLRESEDRFRSIVESSDDWIWEIDRDHCLSYSNDAVTRILGYTPGDLVGAPTMDTILINDRAGVEQRLAQSTQQKKGWHQWQMRWRHRNGSVRTLESTAIPRLDENGDLIGFRGVDRDITLRLQNEARIRSMVRIHAVLSALGNAVLRARNRDDLLQQVCEVAVDQGGFVTAAICQSSGEEALGLTHCAGLDHLREHNKEFPASCASIDPEILCATSRVALQENCNVIVRDFSTDPHISERMRQDMAALGVGAQIALPIGNPPWGVMALQASDPQVFDAQELALLRLLTEEIDYGASFLAKSERLEFLAYHNPISGLYNRAAFQARLEPRLQREALAIALVDIARFGAVNESYGRAFGDALLKEVGQRLRALFGITTLVAHPEADVFMLAYTATGNHDAQREHLEGVIRAFDRDPFVINGQEIRINLRGSLAFAPEHGRDAESIEHSAQAARFEGAKRKQQVYVFNEELRGRAKHRLTLESELRQALLHQEFELFYQPKFFTESQILSGAEALLRWRHPARGLISPAEFIPLLEESGLIVPVGHWVMREALRQTLGWRQTHAGFRVAVNISARELHDDDFMQECRSILQAHADDQPLDIELTESLLMDDINHSMWLLQGLRDLGCRIAIDDFGTGYSSLNYLARLPVDTIKIDQSFVATLAHSPESMSLVTNIVNLAHSLSLQLVAEGVEEEDQMKLLRLLRCEQLQGYLLGRPVPAAQFEATYLQASH